MHPIEHLRAVARAGAVDAVQLTAEAAYALGAFAADPAGLVAAARRLVARHPEVGSLWWLCNRVLVAGDPAAEARRATREVEDDPTAGVLATALPDGGQVLVVGWPTTVVEALIRRGDVEVLAVDDGTGRDLGRLLARLEVDAVEVPAEGLGAAAAAADLVVLEAEAAGPEAALAAPGSRAAAAVARAAGVPVWLVAPVGRVLPPALFEACRAGAWDADEPWDAGRDLVPATLLDQVVGPTGPVPPEEGLAPAGAGGVAPELLRPGLTPGSHRP